MRDFSSIAINALFVCLIALATPVLADESGALLRKFPSLKNPRMDVIVARVSDQSVEAGTNAKPPSGTLEIIEVLRGTKVTGTRPFVISANRGPDAYISKEEFYRQGELRPDWADEELLAPAPGTRLILFCGSTEKPLSNPCYISTGNYIPYSDEVRAEVLRVMAAPERSGAVQIPLFFAITALPILAILLLFVLSSQRLKFAFGAGFPLLSILLYFYYETGISTYSNIRVDLLLIFPALVVDAFLIGGVCIAFGWRTACSKRAQE